MSIKKRIILASVLLAVFFISLGSTVLFGYRYVTNITSTANALDNQAKFLQMMLRGINEVIVTEGTPQSVEIVELGIKGFNEIHTKILSNPKNTDYYHVYTEKIKPEWKKIIVRSQPFLEHHLDVEDDKLIIQYGKLITKTDKLIDEINNLSIKTRTMVDSNSKATEFIQYIMFAMLLLSTIFILYMSYNHYRSIIAPIKDLNEIAKGFENGDLSISMNATRQDEFGVLASHFNNAVTKLSKMISLVKQVTTTITESSKSLSESSMQITKNSNEQSSQTNQAASATEELSSSFIDMAKNSTDVAELSKTALNNIFDSSDVITRTVEGMNEISASVMASSSRIEELSKGSQQISEIIKVIDDIAGQTNLLALNAAIEAARAGEQGRGFAVVADEVRKLAERTSTSTNEIGNMIHKIQENTVNTIESMQNWKGKVEKGVQLSGQTGSALQMITVHISEVSDKIRQIAASAEEQSSVGQTISSHIESVANLAMQTANSAKTSSDSTQQLTDLVLQLQDLVNGFKLQNEICNDSSSYMQNINSESVESNPGLGATESIKLTN